MGSLKAQKVAIKLSESIRTGKPRTYFDILKEVGYSDSTAKSPTLVTRTKAYKKALELENIPIVDGLSSLINQIKLAIAEKDFTQEDLRTLVGSLDILTKNKQLLSGGATERQVFVLPSEVLQKNAIESSKDHTLLPAVNSTNGSTEPLKPD